MEHGDLEMHPKVSAQAGLEEAAGRRASAASPREGHLGFLSSDEYGGHEVTAGGEGGCVW